MRPVSGDFMESARLAVVKSGQAPDDSIRYMAKAIPIYAQWEPTPEMARAGGCPNCTYLGLWTQAWSGYAGSQHGLIILFERGIRYIGHNLWQLTYDTLLHEFGHALQLDHVLDAMQAQARGQYATSGGCGG